MLGLSAAGNQCVMGACHLLDGAPEGCRQGGDDSLAIKFSETEHSV